MSLPNTSSSPEPWNEATASELLSRFASVRGGLMPALHALQRRFGCVPKPAVALLADAFNISRAEVHGVLSFYHDFRDTPRGRHVLKLCRAEACQAVGGVALGDAARQALGLEWGETSADGRWTLEPVFCLGLCACGPSALLDGQPKARLDAAALQALIAQEDE